MLLINNSFSNNSIINDDYCDNGDDEMNTSACSGYKNNIITKPSFICFNKEYYIEKIYNSRVNDGICDCCDGSDEINNNNNNNIKCINNCKEIGEIKLYEENINTLNRLKGIEKKDKIKLIINSKLNLLKDQYDKAQINLPKYKEILKSLRSEIISKDKKDIKKQEYILDQAKIEIINNYSNIKISNIDMINLIGLLALRGGEEAVEVILNSINNENNNNDIFIDDTEALYIAMNYEKSLSNIINNDGNIIISNINNNDSDLLKKMINSLSLNNINYNLLLNILPDISIYTLKSGQLLNCFNDLNISIKQFSIKLIEMDKYFSETYDIIKLNQKIKDIEYEINNFSYIIKDYNKMKQKDFGPNKILYEFWNKCYNYNNTEYSYNICPFQDVKQNNNVILGRYTKYILEKDINNNNNNNVDKLSLLFTQGDRCMSIPSRRPRVFQLNIECSLLDGHNIIDIIEIEKCKYIGTMKSSIGC